MRCAAPKRAGCGGVARRHTPPRAAPQPRGADAPASTSAAAPASSSPVGAAPSGEAGEGGPAGVGAAAAAAPRPAAPPPPPPPHLDVHDGLTGLWRKDLDYADARGWRDAGVALDALDSGVQRLAALFGAGRRPALEAELRRQTAELAVAQQQERLSELRLAHTAARLRVAEARAAPEPPPSCGGADCWLPVAPSSSLGPSVPLAVALLERPWALFRGPGGAPALLDDACPHRACPLSLGVVVGPQRRLQCAYHGWEYACSGECEAMPSTPFLPGVRVAASLPCAEQGGLVWAWAGPGTPDAALPPHFGVDDDGFDAVATVAADVRGAAPGPLLDALAITAWGHGDADDDDDDGDDDGGGGDDDAVDVGPGGRGAAGAAADEGDGGGGGGGDDPFASAAAAALRTALPGLGGLQATAPLSLARPPPGSVLVAVLPLGGGGGAAAPADGPPAAPAAPAAAASAHPPAPAPRLVRCVHWAVPGGPGGTRLLFRVALNFGVGGGPLAGVAPRVWAAYARGLLRAQLARAQPRARAGARAQGRHADAAR